LASVAARHRIRREGRVGSLAVCTAAAPRPRYLMTEDGARTPIATEDRPGRPRPDLALRKEAIFRAGRYPTAQDPGQALP
jgi:hypothetical protein